MQIPTSLPVRPAMPTRSLDWLSVTIHADTEESQEVVAMDAQNRLAHWARQSPTPQEPWHWQPTSGHHGYKAAMREVRTGATIQWAGTEAQGVHVTLPGTACRSLAATHPDGPPRFYRWLARKFPVTASRADWAIDSETLFPTYFLLGRRADNAAGVLLPGPTVRTRLTTPLRATETATADGKAALTVYFGSRQSECLVRVYDKARQLGAGDKTEIARLAPWYRLEYELHNEAASKSLDLYDDGGWPAVAGLLMRRLALVVPQGGDSNQSRWPLHAAYATAMGEAVPPAPTPQHREATELTKRLDWLAQVGARTLVEATALYGWQAVEDHLQGAMALYRSTHPDTVATTPTAQGVDQ